MIFFPAFNISFLPFIVRQVSPHSAPTSTRRVQRALLVNGGAYIDQLLQPWDVTASSLRSYGARGSVRLKEAWFFSNSFGRIPHPGRFWLTGLSICLSGLSRCFWYW